MLIKTKLQQKEGEMEVYAINKHQAFEIMLTGIYLRYQTTKIYIT